MTTIYASAISRIVKSDCGKRDRRLVQIMGQADRESVTIWTSNAARHQLAALSRIRRALVARGYRVDVHKQASLSWLTMFKPHYILLVTKPEAAK